MKLRRFNARGIARLEQELDAARQGSIIDFVALRDDDALTEVVSPPVTFKVRAFSNRRDAAEFLIKTLQPLEQAGVPFQRDAGLWAWLAVTWADHLAPSDPNGVRRVRDNARWIPQINNYKKYYRHLLASPYSIYSAHIDDPDVADAVLATAVDAPGEVVEQIASRQEMTASRSVLGTVTALYYDSKTKKLKRGVATKGAGSSRRLADVLLQLDVTWDIFGMDVDELLNKLPTEFDRFKTKK